RSSDLGALQVQVGAREVVVAPGTAGATAALHLQRRERDEPLGVLELGVANDLVELTDRSVDVRILLELVERKLSASAVKLALDLQGLLEARGGVRVVVAALVRQASVVDGLGQLVAACGPLVCGRLLEQVRSE